jgi:hypothetical protein
MPVPHKNLDVWINLAILAQKMCSLRTGLSFDGQNVHIFKTGQKSLKNHEKVINCQHPPIALSLLDFLTHLCTNQTEG